MPRYRLDFVGRRSEEILERARPTSQEAARSSDEPDRPFRINTHSRKSSEIARLPRSSPGEKRELPARMGEGDPESVGRFSLDMERPSFVGGRKGSLAARSLTPDRRAQRRSMSQGRGSSDGRRSVDGFRINTHGVYKCMHACSMVCVRARARSRACVCLRAFWCVCDCVCCWDVVTHTRRRSGDTGRDSEEIFQRTPSNPKDQPYRINTHGRSSEEITRPGRRVSVEVGMVEAPIRFKASSLFKSAAKYCKQCGYGTTKAERVSCKKCGAADWLSPQEKARMQM